MARACAGFEFGPWLFAGFEFSSRRIEAIDHYFVDPEIGSQGVALGTIEDDAMSVWSFLLFLDARAFVLLHVDRHSECAVGTYRERGDVAAGVVCDEQGFSFAIHGEMTGIGASRRLLIQQP